MTKLVLDKLHPHSAEVENIGPAVQVADPCARNDMPVLCIAKMPRSSILTMPRTPSPRSPVMKEPRSHCPEVKFSVRQSEEIGFPIHQPPHTASCGGSVGAMKDAKAYRDSGSGGMEQFSKPKVSIEVRLSSADCPPRTKSPVGDSGFKDVPENTRICHII